MQLTLNKNTAAMGVINKLRSGTSPRLNLRRRGRSKSKVAAKAETNAVELGAVQVTSNPKEVTFDPMRYFNWMTNTLDDVNPPATSADACEDTSSNGDGDMDKVGHADDHTHCTGWPWGLLSSLCGGGSAPVTSAPSLFAGQADDLTIESTRESTTYDSSCDDDTGESSQHSLSRLDQVLELPQRQCSDDVSDITSVASIDDDYSDTDSECYSHSEGRNRARTKLKLVINRVKR